MAENKINAYLSKHEQWAIKLADIRNLLLSTELEETIKWGMPVYTINNKNVIGLSGFKHHFGLWFYQGVFLKDKKKILVNAQEGKTKGMRHMRFTKDSKIDNKLILQYVNEAIQNSKDGKEIKAEKKNIEVPQILKDLLKSNKALSQSFEKFTPGKKKEFYEYIGSAKRKETQNNRLEAAKEMIQKGVAPNDKYRK